MNTTTTKEYEMAKYTLVIWQDGRVEAHTPTCKDLAKAASRADLIDVDSLDREADDEPIRQMRCVEGARREARA